MRSLCPTVIMSKSSVASSKEVGGDTFDWVQLKKELDTDQVTGKLRADTMSITNMEKFKMRFWENPLIPIGKEKFGE